MWSQVSPRLPPRIHYSLPRFDEPERLSLTWPVQPPKAVLLIHDMQNHFLRPFDPGSLLPEVIQRILKLRSLCDSNDIPVVYSCQPPDQSPAQRGLLTDFWGPGLSGDPEGAKVVAELAPRDHHQVLTKWRYSAFARTELQEYMQRAGRDQLLITGVYGHIGCHATARDAFMRDIQPFMIGDAIADFGPEEHLHTLHDVALRCGVVRSCEAVLRELGAHAHSDRPGPDAPTDKASQRFFSLLFAEGGVPGGWDEQTELIDLGIDSIRWMNAVDEWNQSYRVALDWGEVAACVDIAQLRSLLAQHAKSAN